MGCQVYLIVFGIFRSAIEAVSGPDFFLAAPTTRTRPSWYLPILPDITNLLTKSLRLHSPNLYTIKAFKANKGDLDTDGIHFSPLTGLDYVLHLLNEPRFAFTQFYNVKIP